MKKMGLSAEIPKLKTIQNNRIRKISHQSHPFLKCTSVGVGRPAAERIGTIIG